MIEMGVDEFVRRMRYLLDHDAMAAFFLGAGASMSSDVPGAAELSELWLRQLHDMETGGATTFEDWRDKRCPEFDPAAAALSYAALMHRRFPTRAERQQEVERIVRGHDPGFGYATLAQLLAHERVGQRCNLVLTTNFDDLVADALYLFTDVRPLVVTHEALAGYAAVGRTRPTIIKLHGDAMLEPRNTVAEVAELAPAFVQALQSHLRSRALVIIGYGGNDKGVLDALSSLPDQTITHGIYWVNDVVPQNEFGAWLRSRQEAIWVQHLDFDELMAVFKTEFRLPYPDTDRFDDLLRNYRDTFSDLQERVQRQQDPASAVARSVEEVRQKFDSWFSVELEAQKFKVGEPDRASAVYEAGLLDFPDSPELLGRYAVFLSDVRREHDRAQELYERAITADPNHASALGSYAIFLKNVRHEFDRAQQFYERAITASPNHATNLGNYALFLSDVRREHDRAQELYERAITADPNHANNLGNYAGFLSDVRREHDRAQELHERAITADPDHANALGSYAVFLKNVRHEFDRAQELYERAITADPNHANALGNYAGFLYSLGEAAQAREFVRRTRGLSEFSHEARASLRLEVDLYELANDEQLSVEEEGERVAELKALLLGGNRSRGWSFDANVERARAMGKSDDEVAFLTALAAVITDEAPIESLDGFEEWTAA